MGARKRRHEHLGFPRAPLRFLRPNSCPCLGPNRHVPSIRGRPSARIVFSCGLCRLFNQLMSASGDPVPKAGRRQSHYRLYLHPSCALPALANFNAQSEAWASFLVKMEFPGHLSQW